MFNKSCWHIECDWDQWKMEWHKVYHLLLCSRLSITVCHFEYKKPEIPWNRLRNNISFTIFLLHLNLFKICCSKHFNWIWWVSLNRPNQFTFCYKQKKSLSTFNRSTLICHEICQYFYWVISPRPSISNPKYWWFELRNKYINKTERIQFMAK